MTWQRPAKWLDTDLLDPLWHEVEFEKSIRRAEALRRCKQHTVEGMAAKLAGEAARGTLHLQRAEWFREFYKFTQEEIDACDI